MKSIFVFMLLLMFSSSYSQTKPDSVSVTCIPNYQLREAVRVNEKYKFYRTSDSLKTGIIFTMGLQLLNRDSLVGNLRKLDTNNQLIIADKDKIIGKADQQIKLSVDQKDMWMKKAKWWETKTFLVGGIGISTTALFFYLWIKNQ